MENIDQQCSLCNSSTSLLQVKNKWICEGCLHIGVEKLTLKWKKPLNTLLKEYSDVCNQCVTSDPQKLIPRARVSGLKIRAVLDFLGLPKDHVLLAAVRKINRLLNKTREAEVFLAEVKENIDENKICTSISKAAEKKKQKLQQQIQVKFPAILNDSFVQHVQEFLDHELIFYVLPIVKENVLFQYEERFQLLVDDFQRSIEENGDTAPATFKTLHAVQKGAVSLHYIYQFLNKTFNENYQDEEMHYRDLQQLYSDLYHTEAWFKQIRSYQKKKDVPNDVQNSLKENIHDLIEKIGSLDETSTQA